MSTRSVRAAAAIATTVAVTVAAVATPGPAAAATVLAPGSAVVVYNNDGSDGEWCTAGFVARNVNNAALMFLAGHCAAGERVMMESPTGALVQAAEIVVSQFDGSQGESSDIAVMRPLGAAPLVSSVNGAPVSAVQSEVHPGMRLCMLGATSGQACGTVVQVSKSKVKFSAGVAGGDSGGPVWYEAPDGSVRAVGIVIRQSGEGWTVAELLAPWLTRYRLGL